jgi:hypothetical protein
VACVIKFYFLEIFQKDATNNPFLEKIGRGSRNLTILLDVKITANNNTTFSLSIGNDTKSTKQRTYLS